jgi:AcrR family transcriptional regulator
LSRQAIIDAALRILDREGADALTVRRLGAELNTGSATLYWHIGGTDELGELIYDHVMGAITLPPADPARWQEQVKDLGRQAYQAMLAHREVVRYSVGRVPVGPNMLRVMEWTVGLLRDAGIPPEPAAYFGDILGRYLDVSILETVVTGAPPPELVGQYFAGLPPERYPNLIDAMRRGFSTDPIDRFEFGLDVLVRGLAGFIE